MPGYPVRWLFGKALWTYAADDHRNSSHDCIPKVRARRVQQVANVGVDFLFCPTQRHVDWAATQQHLLQGFIPDWLISSCKPASMSAAGVAAWHRAADATSVRA